MLLVLGRRGSGLPFVRYPGLVYLQEKMAVWTAIQRSQKEVRRWRRKCLVVVQMFYMLVSRLGPGVWNEDQVTKCLQSIMFLVCLFCYSP